MDDDPATELNSVARSPAIRSANLNFRAIKKPAGASSPRYAPLRGFRARCRVRLRTHLPGSPSRCSGDAEVPMRQLLLTIMLVVFLLLLTLFVATPVAAGFEGLR